MRQYTGDRADAPCLECPNCEGKIYFEGEQLGCECVECFGECLLPKNFIPQPCDLDTPKEVTV